MMKKHKKPEVAKGSFSTVRIVAFGFLCFIFIGSLLLWLPISTTEPIAYIDALFTSVSAICVTGLSTIVPATQLTVFGKIILLILIQIGGLGVIACTIILFMLISKRITMSERIVIQQAYNLESLSGMVAFIIHIIQVTLVVQLVGALLFAIRFIPMFGFWNGIGMSIYHAVSAFCNADLNIMYPETYAIFERSPLMNFTTMGLIICGGLGFTVWTDIVHNAKQVFKKSLPPSRLITRLGVQSKIVLSFSAVLLVFGALVFFLLERNNDATMGTLSLPQQLMASLFQATTTRSGGYATLPQQYLTSTSKLFSTVLMFIGASPGSTAGGVKTTTFVMILLTTIAVLRGKSSVEIFGRRIPISIVRSGIAITFMYLVLLIVATMILSVLEPRQDFLDLWFEATSALGTVGLSTGITAEISRYSQALLMVLMYLGRIGPVTAALVFVGRGSATREVRELPEKYIMLG